MSEIQKLVEIIKLLISKRDDFAQPKFRLNKSNPVSTSDVPTSATILNPWSKPLAECWVGEDNDDIGLPLTFAFSSTNEASSATASRQPAVSYCAGLLCDSGNALNETGLDGNDLLAYLRLEYSVGGVTQELIFDARPGTYQLPPCTWARATLFAFRAAGSELDTIRSRCEGSFARGTTTQATRPRTTAIAVDEGAVFSETLLLPANVRWIDVTPDNGFVITIAARGFWMQRDFNAVPKTYDPPWGPVELQSAANTLDVQADGDFTVELYQEF